MVIYSYRKNSHKKVSPVSNAERQFSRVRLILFTHGFISMLYTHSTSHCVLTSTGYVISDHSSFSYVFELKPVLKNGIHLHMYMYKDC